MKEKRRPATGCRERPAARCRRHIRNANDSRSQFLRDAAQEQTRVCLSLRYREKRWLNVGEAAASEAGNFQGAIEPARTASPK